MSETTPRSQLAFVERQARTAARRVELEPALAQLAVAGKEAYASLRPLAKHVGDVDRDYPLRHQRIRGLGVGGPAGIIADYLMVAFGNHHDLTLYHNFGDGRQFAWQYQRSLLIGDLESEQTKVEENRQPRRTAYGGGVMEIVVATYVYPQQVGIDGMYTEMLCDGFNDYAGAEQYISAFETDLEEAVRRFS